MREFVIPKNAIEEQAAIHIAAPPERVAAVYRDVEHWGDTFPATIQSARVIKTGNNWKEVDVTHKQEGRVPNTLIDLSPTEIGLWESKKKFNAGFLNRFERTANGETHYVVHAYIRPKGIYKLIRPFLVGYVHRQALKQVKGYVLEPLKVAVEKQLASQTNMK
ncbi:MAG TPA: SRPBCC family protein [Anaerolineales bacterium]|jgi:hypothetical protein|nr:SRPBCC family protein [Anaerolineales bacterium]